MRNNLYLIVSKYMVDLQTAFDKALEVALISRSHSGFCGIIATTENCNSETCVSGRCCCQLVLVKTFIFVNPVSLVKELLTKGRACVIA